MSRFAIEESDRAADSPARQLIYEGINELVQDRFASWTGFEIPVLAADRVLYAVSTTDQDIVGVLCFSCEEETKIATVSLIYVEHSSRKQGACRALWDALLDRVKRHQFTVTVGPVHASNLVAQQVFHALRCEPQSVTYGHRG